MYCALLHRFSHLACEQFRLLCAGLGRLGGPIAGKTGDVPIICSLNSFLSAGLCRLGVPNSGYEAHCVGAESTLGISVIWSLDGVVLAVLQVSCAAGDRREVGVQHNDTQPAQSHRQDVSEQEPCRVHRNPEGR